MKTDLDPALVRLDDYVRGHATEDEALAFEEDLFARALAGQAPELAVRSGLASTFRAMKENGSIELWLTAKGVEELVASGIRVARLTWTEAGPPAEMPDLGPDVDVLVTKVPIDLRGARRVDVEIIDNDGRHMKTMPEVSFDPDDGAVYACCDAELAKIAGRTRVMSRVWVTDESGKRFVAAELPT